MSAVSRRARTSWWLCGVGAGLAVSALLAGCALHPVGPDYTPPPAPLPPTLAHADAIAPDPQASAATDTAWWQGFHDPRLADLVVQAQAHNTDLAQALARVEQARARVDAAGAARRPTLDASGGASRIRQSRESAIGRIVTALHVPRDYDEYTLGVQASWEIDLFGGLARGREAALDDLAAAQAAASAVGVRVAAETADAYLALRGLEARRRLATDAVGNERLRVELLGQRVHYGLSTSRELSRARAGLAEAEAALAPLGAAAEAQRNRLDVLTGMAPGTGPEDTPVVSGSAATPASTSTSTSAPASIPEAPPPSGSAAPTDLLRRRPDVVLAERRLAASTARVGVAVAEYYPHVSLGGLFGLAGTTLGGGSFLGGDAVQASGGVALRWRLFDFGRVDAEVAGARSGQAEALAAWRGAVLLAAEDVETSLARLVAAHDTRRWLTREVAELDAARAEARAAFARGVVARFEVIDAEREWLVAADRLAAARADEARAAVAGYRALGGGWQVDPESTATAGAAADPAPVSVSAPRLAQATPTHS